MIHLVYISSATSWPSDDDLEALLEQSRARNLRQNITGMLLYKNATFLQVLEGQEKDVREVYQSIVNDPRNTGNVTLFEEKIRQREFPNWSMGFKNLVASTPEELCGCQDIFSDKPAKSISAENSSRAWQLLKQFSGNE